MGEYEEIDLSLKDGMYAESFNPEDLCIFGVPSYGGRVPNVVLDRIREMNGNGTKAILVTSFRNRDYEDTLKELSDTLEKRNFTNFAGIAAVSEHSIMREFATGRPDASDERELREFSKKIKEKLENKDTFEEVHFPGNFPYRAYDGVAFKPKAGRKCIRCGLSAISCPVGAIPEEDPKKTDKDLCISCMRCLQTCPENARKLNPILLRIASLKMRSSCKDRKENELFI